MTKLPHTKNVPIKINGYCGICAACLEPMKSGESARIREGGRHFHKTCLEDRPDNYYVKLEHRLLKREPKRNKTGGDQHS
ncbi:hypothetical protein FACS1894217_05700 [Clostridia bacterium]|nr:hypothetical protein FACS1894217_05700 [Clostridia bacterium]